MCICMCMCMSMSMYMYMMCIHFCMHIFLLVFLQKLLCQYFPKVNKLSELRTISTVLKFVRRDYFHVIMSFP